MFCSCLCRVRFTALVAMVLLAGVASQAQDASVLYALKLPPAKTLSNQLMGLVRQIAPGPQSEMYPMMFLGAFGYPQFNGVSETENITLFFFKADKGEESPPFVILSKMADDAPMRKSLTLKSKGNNAMMSFLAPGLEVREQDGWTLFAPDEATFAYADDLPKLVQLAQDISGFDVTARFWVGPENMANWAEQMKASMAEEHVLMGLDEGNPSLLRKQSFVDFLALAGRNLEWAQIGFDLNEQAVSFGATALALDGTPEAKLFSSEAGGATPVAELLPISTIAYVSQWDRQSWVDYVDVLAERAGMVALPEAKPYLEQTLELVHELAPTFSNSTAGTIKIQGELEDYTQNAVMFTKADYELYHRAMAFYANELVPFVLGYFADPEMLTAMPKWQLKANVAEISGQPVDALEQSYETTEFDWKNPEAEPQAILKTETTYTVIADGVLASSSDLDELRNIVARAAAKESAENNVASRIQLDKDQLMGLELRLNDLIHLFTQVVEPESEQARQALMKLSKRNLEPVTSSVFLGDNRLTYRWTAPVSSIQAVSETVQTIKQAEMEMNYGESSEAVDVPAPRPQTDTVE